MTSRVKANSLPQSLIKNNLIGVALIVGTYDLPAAGGFCEGAPSGAASGSRREDFGRNRSRRETMEENVHGLVFSREDGKPITMDATPAR
jgi:hypothetical protein